MIYAISDLHICSAGNKPMEVFGDNWVGHLDITKESWLQSVTPEDTVFIAGDLSWAMRLDDAKDDFAFLGSLPGQIVLVRGNHDYWWSSYNKVMLALPPNVHALQNNAYRLEREHAVVCGSRGWTIADEQSTDDDKKIYARELLRMQMALDDAVRKMQDGDALYVMTHYPPYADYFAATEMTALFERYHVDTVIYGHIHGKNSLHRPEFTLGGVRYMLTSTDMVDHRLVKVR